MFSKLIAKLIYIKLNECEHFGKRTKFLRYVREYLKYEVTREGCSRRQTYNLEEWKCRYWQVYQWRPRPMKHCPFDHFCQTSQLFIR